MLVRQFSVFVLGCAFFCAAGFVAPEASAQRGGEMPPVAVETAIVVTQPLSHTIQAVGTLRADESVVIRPELAGRIEKIHFQEGQSVAAGAELVSLDASLIAAELREARANLAVSNRVYERASDLIGRKLVSQAEYDAARASLAVDRARLASVETRLAKTVIKAPFAGVLGLRQISVGDYVEIGEELVSIVKLDPIKADFRVPQVHLAKLAVGQRVDIRVDTFPGRIVQRRGAGDRSADRCIRAQCPVAGDRAESRTTTAPGPVRAGLAGTRPQRRGDADSGRSALAAGPAPVRLPHRGRRGEADRDQHRHPLRRSRRGAVGNLRRRRGRHGRAIETDGRGEGRPEIGCSGQRARVRRCDARRAAPVVAVPE